MFCEELFGACRFCRRTNGWCLPRKHVGYGHKRRQELARRRVARAEAGEVDGREPRCPDGWEDPAPDAFGVQAKAK
eukprot:1195491-Alexandrium_andersonii.AAC.1